jgi:hypothetical protein
MTITQHEDALVNALKTGNRSRVNSIMSKVTGRPFSFSNFINVVTQDGIISPVTNAYVNAQNAMDGTGMSTDAAVMIVTDLTLIYEV